MMSPVLVVLMLLSASGVSHAYKFVELSHPQNPSTLYWPGVPTFNRSVVFADTNDNNIWIEVGAFSSGEHGGTHIDVPRHFFKTGPDLKDMPLDRFVAEGVMIDCSAEAEQDYDYAVTVEKIQQWEGKHGRIPNQAAVLFYFGYAPKFSDPTAYFNTQDIDNPQAFHFPFVSIEATKWLVNNRDLKMIGFDVPSPDGPRDATFPVHMELLPRKIVIMENVNIPLSLPPRDFRLHAAPIRIEGGTGTQTRIYAMLYDRVNDGAVQMTCLSLLSMFVCLVAAVFFSRHRLC